LRWWRPLPPWLSSSPVGCCLHERFDIAGPWRLMRGTGCGLPRIFFVLTIALMALDRLLDPAKTKLVRSLTDPTAWTLNEAALRYAVDFPVSMLWIVTWAVMVGIVLDALERAPSDRRAAAVAYNRRSATSSIRWLSSLVRMRCARWRVGRMFSCRIDQIDARPDRGRGRGRPRRPTARNSAGSRTSGHGTRCRARRKKRSTYQRCSTSSRASR